jgi:LmbE family N-acetylglucosaminyl deacetylase
MKFKNKTAELFIPDQTNEETALKRTTLMSIGAHQDDLEIMSASPILESLDSEEKWFTGVVVTNGSGSPRAGKYAKYTDNEMCGVRKEEQKEAAIVGKYGALALLDYKSKEVKEKTKHDVLNEISSLIEKASPEIVYTHNLADKHETHVAVALRTIQAIRNLPKEKRPRELLGCETWRDLDWLPDEEKVVLNCSSHMELQEKLISLFDSQVVGGKRYDLATIGRRRAHATFFQSNKTDTLSGASFAMDLTPLIEDCSMDIQDYVQDLMTRFSQSVSFLITKLG